MSKKSKNKKVLIGFSGGVDSTASCILLREKGYEVTGYFFDVLGCNLEALSYASRIASQLGIELITEDVSDDFKRLVADNFCTEYLAGRTPNPCVVCNPRIKFRKLIECADRIGASYISTGHYARLKKTSDGVFVRRAVNISKDQSYMLYRLPESTLRRLILPLGEISDKSEVRRLAAENGLDNALKKDSQEICFINSDDNYADYIKRTGAKSEAGHFIDKKGNVLGNHDGILNYTVGQRKGLGIAIGKPVFVTGIDPVKNTVTLGDGEDLLSNEIRSRDNVFTAGNAAEYEGRYISAKIRYAAQPEKAKLHIEGDEIITVFDRPQRAAAPGQSIVFYDNDIVIGGGFMV